MLRNFHKILTHKLCHFDRFHFDRIHFDRVHCDRVHFDRVHCERVHFDRVHFDRVHFDRIHCDRIHFDRNPTQSEKILNSIQPMELNSIRSDCITENVLLKSASRYQQSQFYLLCLILRDYYVIGKYLFCYHHSFEE